MAIERRFHDLTLHGQALSESFRALRITVIEDRPQADDAALADLLGDAIEEALGWLEEAIKPICDLTGSQIHLEQAWRALTRCQNNFGRFELGCSELLSYRRMSALVQLGRQRSGEWQAWARCVQDGLERLPPLMHEVRLAIHDCWQELGEHAGLRSMSVQNTNVGQQVLISSNRGEWPGMPKINTD